MEQEDNFLRGTVFLNNLKKKKMLLLLLWPGHDPSKGFVCLYAFKQSVINAAVCGASCYLPL